MDNFIQKCIKGTSNISEIDDYIDMWHSSSTKLELPAYLGMTEKEYDMFVKDEKYLIELIKTKS